MAVWKDVCGKQGQVEECMRFRGEWSWTTLSVCSHVYSGRPVHVGSGTRARTVHVLCQIVGSCRGTHRRFGDEHDRDYMYPLL